MDAVNSYSCKCLEGFDGKNCENSKWKHMHFAIAMLCSYKVNAKIMYMFVVQLSLQFVQILTTVLPYPV